jgi:serine/threonine protein kinase
MMSGNGLDLKPGDKIGKYEILRVLAKGGIGTVYLAEQKIIKRKVVVDLFTTKDEDILAMARQGAEILASVDHPYIVDLYDVDEYEGCFYQVVEYIDGKSLSEMVESGDELPVTVVLELMICIADALDYLHGLGIIHGDVKPANIIVSSGGNPLLVDFGLSSSPEDDLLQGRIMGTPSYMPPEAWRGEREERSDLWALGMTLHYLLTGRVAFKVTDEEELAKLIASEAPLDISDLRKSVPEPVARIVERCIQKDLDRRYQSAVEVRRDLESALAYLESGQSETATVAMAPLWAGSTILLNVEYKEPGIPGQYL